MTMQNDNNCCADLEQKLDQLQKDLVAEGIFGNPPASGIWAATGALATLGGGIVAGLIAPISIPVVVTTAGLVATGAFVAENWENISEGRGLGDEFNQDLEARLVPVLDPVVRSIISGADTLSNIAEMTWTNLGIGIEREIAHFTQDLEMRLNDWNWRPGGYIDWEAIETGTIEHANRFDTVPIDERVETQQYGFSIGPEYRPLPGTYPPGMPGTEEGDYDFLATIRAELDSIRGETNTATTTATTATATATDANTTANQANNAIGGILLTLASLAASVAHAIQTANNAAAAASSATVNSATAESDNRLPPYAQQLP